MIKDLRIKKYYSSNPDFNRDEKLIKYSSRFIPIAIGILSNNNIIILLLILLALVERLFIDLGPNVELITLVTFIAGFYLNKKTAVLIPLLVLAISDIFLGNTNIMLFTWSGYLVIGLISLIGQILINKFYCSNQDEVLSENFSLRSKNIGRVVLATFGGIISSLWFYVWTNFGVWLLDSWGMYPKTLNGLITCYINGIPFLKNQLLGNLIIIPLGFSALEFSLWISKQFIPQRNKIANGMTTRTLLPIKTGMSYDWYNLKRQLLKYKVLG